MKEKQLKFLKEFLESRIATEGYKNRPEENLAKGLDFKWLTVENAIEKAEQDAKAIAKIEELIAHIEANEEVWYAAALVGIINCYTDNTYKTLFTSDLLSWLTYQD